MMVRRSIFLLVMLYFSIIIFMLNPLHGYYSGGYMNHFGFRHDPAVNWCKELRWRYPPSPDMVALVSFPGSGNTWLRYLLQQATGMVTGSIYMDHFLRMHGFPAENVADGSVLVVKTHEDPPVEPDKFKSAILLIRNPRDAFLADFNRLHEGHIGTAPKPAFEKKYQHKKSDWMRYVSTQLTVWETLHQLWLTKFTGPVQIVFYEVLVKDTKNTLQGMVDFLNHNVTEADMNCALANKEGIYRRKNKHQDFDPFSAEMYKALDQVRNKVLGMVMDYKKKHGHGVPLTRLQMNKIV